MFEELPNFSTINISVVSTVYIVFLCAISIRRGFAKSSIRLYRSPSNLICDFRHDIIIFHTLAATTSLYAEDAFICKFKIESTSIIQNKRVR